jgi:hypothetical protein
VGSRYLNTVIVLAATVGLACVGPKPEITSVSVHPAAGGHIRVEVLLRNAAGAGEVKVTARLRERRTGRTFVGSRGVDLEAHRSVDAVVDVAAPDGDYEVTAEAAYPPD